jgi:hypothetical protein
MGNKSCGPDIVKYFIVEPAEDPTSVTGSTGNFTVNGDLFVCGTGSTIFTTNIESCDPNSGVTISNILTLYPNGNILPIVDNTVNLGSPIRRFRDVNTVSGTSTVWTSTNQVITPNLNLGLDGLGNQRTITADNSILQNDVLLGGSY